MEIVLKNPYMLILLLFIPVLVLLHYYFFHNIRKRAIKFANFNAMKRVTGTTLITKNNTQLIIRVIIVFLIILAAAQPVIWYSATVSVSDYIIAIDTSASMVNEDVNPDRISVAKTAAGALVDSLKNPKIGLITFSGVTSIKVALTDDKSEVKQALNNLEIDLSGGTDIGGAIVTATNMLNPGEKSKAIVLFTDGSDTSGSYVEENLDFGMDYAKKNHIIIHTVGIGTGIGKAGYLEEVNLPAVYERSGLKIIADYTGGSFNEVKQPTDIRKAFEDIESLSTESLVPFKADHWMMALAFIFLLFEWGLLNTKFRALP